MTIHAPAYAWPWPWKLALVAVWVLALLVLAVALFEIHRSWRSLTARTSAAPRAPFGDIIGDPWSWRGMCLLAAACVFVPVYILLIRYRRMAWDDLVAMSGSMAALWTTAWFAITRGWRRLGNLLMGATVLPLVFFAVRSRGAWPPQLVQFAWLTGIAAGVLLPLWAGWAWVQRVPGPHSAFAAKARLLASAALVLFAGWVLVWWFPRR